jgi:hypothetical protein
MQECPGSMQECPGSMQECPGSMQEQFCGFWVVLGRKIAKDGTEDGEGREWKVASKI